MPFGNDALTIIIKAKDEASRVFDQVGNQTQKLSRQLTAVGKEMTMKVTAPIVAIGAVSVKAATDFTSAMNRVRGLTGSTGEAFAALENQAKELGATTQFSAREAAEGMGFLAMAGFDTNKILGAMPGVLQLAASAQLDLATAADITSNILTGYGMKTEELARVNDVLVKTFSSANTDLVQLGEAMKYAGPVASSAGVQFEETAAAVGLMGNAGIQASMAGTSLRGALVRLLKPPKEAADAIAKLGLETHDSAGELLPMVDIVRQLEDAGANTADMMALFGLRAGPAMAALVEQGSGALADFTEELHQAGGTAQRIAETQMEGMPGALKLLQSATEGARIALGEALAPAVLLIAEKLQSLMEWFIKLPDGVRTTIVVVLGLVAVVGPLLILIGGLIALLPFIAAGFALISVPALLVIGLLGAIGASIAYLALNWEQHWDNIKWAAKGAANYLVGIAEGIANTYVKMVNTIIKALNSIQLSVPDWVPGLGGKSFGINIPLVPEVNLPRFEHGGIVPGPAGKAVPILAHGQERVIPANRGHAGNTYITVTIQNPVVRNREDVQTLKNELDRTLRGLLRDNKLQTT